MKSLAIFSLKRRFLKPCRKIAQLLFKFRLRKPLSVKFLRRRSRKSAAAQQSGFSKIISAFRPRREEREIDRVTELTSFSDQKAPHPSPLTPAYVRMRVAALEEEEEEDDHVEDACRSFEKYLMEMIVDEGKIRDLSDVEELLYCWNELRSPVFVDLVCRFYRELCTDLFSNDR